MCSNHHVQRISDAVRLEELEKRILIANSIISDFVARAKNEDKLGIIPYHVKNYYNTYIALNGEKI